MTTNLLGYLAVGGCEVINNARTVAAVEQWDASPRPAVNLLPRPEWYNHLRAGGFRGCQACTSDEMSGGLTFSLPGTGPTAPWWDPDLFAADGSNISEGFFGMMVDSFTVSDGYVTVEQRLRDRQRRRTLTGKRVGTIRGWLVANSPESVRYGRRWLTEALSEESCRGRDISIMADHCFGFESLAESPFMTGGGCLAGARGFSLDDTGDGGFCVCGGDYIEITFDAGAGIFGHPRELCTVTPDKSGAASEVNWDLLMDGCADMQRIARTRPRPVTEVIIRHDGTFCRADGDTTRIPNDHNVVISAEEYAGKSFEQGVDCPDQECVINLAYFPAQQDPWRPDRYLWSGVNWTQNPGEYTPVLPTGPFPPCWCSVVVGSTISEWVPPPEEPEDDDDPDTETERAPFTVTPQGTVRICRRIELFRTQQPNGRWWRPIGWDPARTGFPEANAEYVIANQCEDVEADPAPPCTEIRTCKVKLNRASWTWQPWGIGYRPESWEPFPPDGCVAYDDVDNPTGGVDGYEYVPVESLHTSTANFRAGGGPVPSRIDEPLRVGCPAFVVTEEWCPVENQHVSDVLKLWIDIEKSRGAIDNMDVALFAPNPALEVPTVDPDPWNMESVPIESFELGSVPGAVTRVTYDPRIQQMTACAGDQVIPARWLRRAPTEWPTIRCDGRYWIRIRFDWIWTATGAVVTLGTIPVLHA